VYLFMRKRYNGSNNGQVIFSHRDAQKALRSGWRRGSNALAELQELGFIKCRNAGEPGPNIRLASEWQLTALECGGQEASKDFARWKNPAPIVIPTTPRRQHDDGYLGSAGSKSSNKGTSVGRVKTPSRIARRRNDDTCRFTTQGACRHR